MCLFPDGVLLLLLFLSILACGALHSSTQAEVLEAFLARSM